MMGATVEAMAVEAVGTAMGATRVEAMGATMEVAVEVAIHPRHFLKSPRRSYSTAAFGSHQSQCTVAVTQPSSLILPALKTSSRIREISLSGGIP